MDLEENLKKIRSRIDQAIAKSAQRQQVCLIAVSKTQPIQKITALYQAGQRDFGENYAQELIQKAEQAQQLGLSEIRWHFIGPLQSNKVKTLLPWVVAIHSIDREKIHQTVAKESARLGKKILLFAQVNIDQEKTKHGFQPDEVSDFLSAAQSTESPVRGLMCIPDPHRGTDAFQRMAALKKTTHTMGVQYLSMGMSDDFELAIAEGATHVRVGTALFGERVAN